MSQQSCKTNTTFCFDVFFIFLSTWPLHLSQGTLRTNNRADVCRGDFFAIRCYERRVEVGLCVCLQRSCPPLSPPAASPPRSFGSSHSVISLLIWLVVNILAMRPSQSSPSLIFATHSPMRRRQQGVATHSFVRASETK